MKKFTSMLLVFSLFITACQTNPIKETPIPVEADGGIGDGAEPLENYIESEVEISDITYTCKDLNYWDESNERKINPTYTLWQDKLNDLFPDLTVYDIGSICELQDGTRFISFASMNVDASSQKIVYMDTNDEIINTSPTELIVRTAGDLSAPTIELISNEILNFSFYHGDGPCMIQNHFELSLEDFSYQLIDESTDCGEHE